MALPVRKLGWVALGAVVLLLLLAWYDGGQEPQRLIEQPVALPGEAS